MKSIKFIRTIPGATLAVAVVVTGSAGVYALTDWFGGDVVITQKDPSVFSVNLSSCKGNLPPGITSQDRHNVQFKILGTPHITASNLQQQLLDQCELDAVTAFYGNRPSGQQYSLYSSQIMHIGDGTITLQYPWDGKLSQKTFQLASDVTVYDESKPVDVQALHPGDKVVFATKPLTPGTWREDTDPVAATNEVQSIFKTEYNTAQAPDATKKGFYQSNNIMPLDWYNQINK